jgi:Arc/MetJ-type ribon-helix-helix transcriptional regulator
MMTIHPSEDLRRIVLDAVRAGLYAREEDVIRGALMRLRQEMGNHRGVKSLDEAALIAELNCQLIAEGLVTHLPDPALDINDDDAEDQPIEIVGEPLSEQIIRERR